MAWILTYASVIEWPLRAVRCSLGCLRDLRTFSSFQASKVATREFRFSVSRYIGYFCARRASKLGGGGGGGANMRVVRGGHFS